MFRVAARLARPAMLLALAIVASACSVAAGGGPLGSPTAGGPSGSPTGPSASPTGKPMAADQVVFRVSWEGGFVMPEALLGRLPIIVVYGDGRVITPGPQLAIYPGPLMSNLQEHTLTAAALDRLIELARTKDLLRTIDYPFPLIADAPDTVLEINLDGQSYRVSANALAEADGAVDGGLDPAMAEGRAALRSFIDALTGIPASDFVDQEHPYAPSALRIYAGKAVVVPNSELPGEQPAVDWPLGNLASAGQAIENSPLNVRCQVVQGDDLTAVLPLLQAANVLSTFRSEGELFSFVVRPLLPGDSGC